jgi:HEPN domain-containing protein
VDARNIYILYFWRMDNMDLNKNKLIKYWIEGSDDDFETMIAMFDSTKYSWSLFIGHLMIEKLLKAYYVKTKSDYPPFIHNLFRLAEMADLNVTNYQKEQLITITAFNINTRYDDYKMSFKKQCTLNFTAEWIDKLIELRTWIKTLILQ